MPRRNIVLANNEIYHVYNRGVEKRSIFKFKRDFVRFVNLLDYYRIDRDISYSKFSSLNNLPSNESLKTTDIDSVLVEVHAYCLMNNHYHLVVKQKSTNGIRRFMSKFQISYARYYNTRHMRVGTLCQSRYKAKWIEDEEDLLKVTSYIHLNPHTSQYVDFENLIDYKWSSYPCYARQTDNFIEKGLLESISGGRKKHLKFIKDQADDNRRLHKVKHLLCAK